MPTGQAGSQEMQYRNQVLQIGGFATEKGTATASAGAATCSYLAGTITTEALTTAAAAEYTLTLTNTKIGASDMVFASADAGASAGTPAIGGCTVTAGQVIITVSNVHASAAFDAAIKIHFFVVKAL
jgi:hypothetical protein